MKDRIQPKKRFGQHFLADETYCQKIVQFAQVSPSAPAIEIGPGTGQLTAYLLQVTRNLTVLEIDPEMVHFLQSRFPEALQDSRLNILHCDVLQFDWKTLESGTVAVGNLPYNIATALLDNMTRARDRFQRITCMVQKEVAERILAEPGHSDYGFFSLMMEFYHVREPGFDVPPGAFRPPPRVTSHVLRLTPRSKLPDCQPRIFEYVVSTAFRHRRKTLRNNLKALSISEHRLTRVLRGVEIEDKERPGEVCLDRYVRLTQQLENLLDTEETNAGLR